MMCWFKKKGKTSQYIISWPFMISYSISRSLPQEVLDGRNDSANAIWVPIEQMTQENASPLVLKVEAELRGFPELDMTSYRNWKVKHAKSTGS